MSIDTSTALKYFKEADPCMYGLLHASLEHVSPIEIPELKTPDQYFGVLVRSIIGQQISVKAASAIRCRVETLVKNLTPENVRQVDFDTLKNCGLSESKTQYIKQDADLWETIPYHDFATFTDEEVIAELTKLYGIGRWSAEMFLMSSLARPDVFSYGDLGLMQSLYQQYNFKPHYVRKIKATVDGWSPHRTLASLSLWHQKDNQPSL